MLHQQDQKSPKTLGKTGGNLYDKYHSRNPIVRLLMSGFLTVFDELTSGLPVNTAYEVGCGEGFLSVRLCKRGLKVDGCDVDEATVREACDNLRSHECKGEFNVCDLYDLPRELSTELVVCCEVLEHVPDPERALEVLLRLATRYLLISVPREPIWRLMNVARGFYIRDFGNTPGHVNHWSKKAFIRLVSRYADIIEVRTPLPWTVLLCKKRCD